MSFLKKLGETAKNTATTIGSKSEELLETGKLKIQRGKLEGSVTDKKTEIGDLMYAAHQQNMVPDSAVLMQKFSEIRELEMHIEEIGTKLSS